MAFVFNEADEKKTKEKHKSNNKIDVIRMYERCRYLLHTHHLHDPNGWVHFSVDKLEDSIPISPPKKSPPKKEKPNATVNVPKPGDDKASN